MLSPAQPIRSGAARKRQEPPDSRRSSDEDVVPGVGGVVGNGAVGASATGGAGSWLAPSSLSLERLRSGQRYCGLLEHNSYSVRF